MNTGLKYNIALLLILMITASCQKVIQLDLRNDTGKLVIEGNITNNPGVQTVTLSRNVPFTSTNTYPPVTGAAVTVYDNTNGHYFPMVEGPAGTYSVTSGVGIAGQSYTMKVVDAGTTYIANSTMPLIVTLDSIAATNNIFDGGSNKKTITAYFQDPPDVSNYYRFVMYVNDVQVKTIFALDDQFSNGKYVSIDLQQNDIDIYSGDTVKVEMQCIDKPVYTYWFTLAQQQGNNPGGAVAPANPPTNITPASLGYFSAHTTQTITLVVK
jgi:hypothetical protein